MRAPGQAHRDQGGGQQFMDFCRQLLRFFQISAPARRQGFYTTLKHRHPNNQN
jgi:hypothetical protein